MIKILQLKERKKIEYEFGGQIWEKEQKLNMLKDIVNEDTKYTPTVAPKPTTFRTPAPRTKTYTTPGKDILIVTNTKYTTTVAPKPTTFNTPAPRAKTYTTPGKDIFIETQYTRTAAPNMPKPTKFRTPAPRTETYTTPGNDIFLETKTQNILQLGHPSLPHSVLLHGEQRRIQHQVRIY